MTTRMMIKAALITARRPQDDFEEYDSDAPESARTSRADSARPGRAGRFLGSDSSPDRVDGWAGPALPLSLSLSLALSLARSLARSHARARARALALSFARFLSLPSPSLSFSFSLPLSHSLSICLPFCLSFSVSRAPSLSTHPPPLARLLLVLSRCLARCLAFSLFRCAVGPAVYIYIYIYIYIITRPAPVKRRSVHPPAHGHTPSSSSAAAAARRRSACSGSGPPDTIKGGQDEPPRFRAGMNRRDFAPGPIAAISRRRVNLFGTLGRAVARKRPSPRNFLEFLQCKNVLCAGR